MSAAGASTSSQIQTREREKTQAGPPSPVVQFWLGPHNEGLLDHPDSVGRITGPCGDTMEISLRIEANRILDSRFRVRGCAVSKACASIAAALAKGKELEEAWDINEIQIAGPLGEIPPDHRHCPLLARDTLRQAIENYCQQEKNRKT